MQHQEYNGWTNYETWKANLELVNPEMYEGTAWINFDNLAGDIRENAWTFAGWDDVDPNSFIAGCLQNFFDEVNWLEIAEGIAEDLELDVMDK